MSKRLLGVVLAASALMGCQTTMDTPSSANRESIIFVDARTADCVGVAPMQCLRVRDSEDQPWQLFYGGIDGFQHREGTSYTLLVKKTPVPNPPADGSSIKTSLVRILSEK